MQLYALLPGKVVVEPKVSQPPGYPKPGQKVPE
jgi:hypothetical protein